MLCTWLGSSDIQIHETKTIDSHYVVYEPSRKRAEGQGGGIAVSLELIELLLLDDLW